MWLLYLLFSCFLMPTLVRSGVENGAHDNFSEYENGLRLTRQGINLTTFQNSIKSAILDVDAAVVASGEGTIKSGHPFGKSTYACVLSFIWMASIICYFVDSFRFI